MSLPPDFPLRESILVSPSVIQDAADLLSAAADSHLVGEFGRAEHLLRLADLPEIRAWIEMIWGKGSASVRQYRHIQGAPPFVSKSARTQDRMPTKATKSTVLRRDGHHCRFCGIPVVSADIRNIFRNSYPQVRIWGSRNQDQHAAFQAMWLQYDHIVPHSRGGNSQDSNIIVTCSGCNFGRMQYTIDELGISDPFLRQPKVSDWDGLERMRTFDVHAPKVALR